MDLTIASLLDVVDRLGWTGGRTDLLTYPEYVIFKGIDTIIDEKRIRLGLKLNVYAPPFNPKAFIQTTEIPNNNTSHHERKRSLAENEQKKITTRINQNIISQNNKEQHDLINQEEQCDNNQHKTRDVRKEIDQSIARNKTLKEYQNNTKLPRDDNLWIWVKNKTRKKANKIEVKLSHHLKNSY